MNKVFGIGRLTKDIEIRYTQKGTAVASFILAIQRDIKNADGVYESDFISCVAYNKTAETMGKYLTKGSQIAIDGRIQTGSYDGQDGKKVYTTDVVIEKVQFLDTKKKEEQEEVSDTEVIQKAMSDDPYKDFGEQIRVDDDGLPF